MSAEHLNIVVTCSKRKTTEPPSDLHLRDVPGKSILERCENWIDRLENRSQKDETARDLYCGEHWSVCQELPAVAQESGWDATLWICSAGYGLIPADTHISAYKATFAKGREDSVVNTVNQLPSVRGAKRRWWSRLSDWSGPLQNVPRSLLELAQGFSNRPLLVVASESYLEAISADVMEAGSCLAEKELLMIVSAGADGIANSETDDALLPVDARFRSHVGGTFSALNARVTELLLTTYDTPELRLSKARRLLENLSCDLPPLKTYDRARQTDEEVRAFIRKELREDPHASRTALLRRLRDTGRACGRERFNDLYRGLVDDS